MVNDTSRYQADRQKYVMADVEPNQQRPRMSLWPPVCQPMDAVARSK